jgi:hypothetical protein
MSRDRHTIVYSEWPATEDRKPSCRAGMSRSSKTHIQHRLQRSTSNLFMASSLRLDFSTGTQVLISHQEIITGQSRTRSLLTVLFNADLVVEQFWRRYTDPLHR